MGQLNLDDYRLVTIEQAKQMFECDADGLLQLALEGVLPGPASGYYSASAVKRAQKVQQLVRFFDLLLSGLG